MPTKKIELMNMTTHVVVMLKDLKNKWKRNSVCGSITEIATPQQQPQQQQEPESAAADVWHSIAKYERLLSSRLECCRCNVRSGTVVMLSCKHIVHLHCMHIQFANSANSNQCPQCYALLPQEDVVYILSKLLKVTSNAITDSDEKIRQLEDAVNMVTRDIASETLMYSTLENQAHASKKVLAALMTEL